MDAQVLKLHPIELISLYSELAEKTMGGQFQFEFSKYVYRPQEISERRDIFRASRDRVTDLFLEERSLLKEKEEIAFHSRIVGKNKILQIPMIDMGCENIEKHLPELKKAFRDSQIKEFSVFHSGRSFHVYGHSLINDEQQLLKFIGRVLLLNLPKAERVIDERWVGHRLMAGYLTLRWTNNNPHYKSLPQKIEMPASVSLSL